MVIANAAARYAGTLRAEPVPYGLFSVVKPETPEDPHWRIGGLEADGDACVVTSEASDPCLAKVTKSAVNAFAEYGGTPFAVYLLNQCKAIGRLDDAKERTERALERAEQVQVERHVQAQVFAPVAVTLGAANMAYSPKTALSMLEGYMALNYIGRCIIHAPREVASNLLPGIDKVDDHLETRLGSYVAAGAGYSANIGPTGVAAPAGSAWMYATGAMVLVRSDADVYDTQLDRATNDFVSLAERAYAAIVDCTVAAVRVQLPA